MNYRKLGKTGLLVSEIGLALFDLVGHCLALAEVLKCCNIFEILKILQHFRKNTALEVGQ